MIDDLVYVSAVEWSPVPGLGLTKQTCFTFDVTRVWGFDLHNIEVYDQNFETWRVAIPYWIADPCGPYTYVIKNATAFERELDD